MTADPMTQAADRHDAEEVRREQQIREQAEEWLSSPEDIEVMFAQEEGYKFEHLSRLLFQLREACRRSDKAMTSNEAGIVMALEKFARSVAEDTIV